MSDGIDFERTLVPPSMCDMHNAMAVRILKLGPNDTWRAGLVVTLILLTRAALASPRVRRRLGWDGSDVKVDATPRDMSVVLNELGCLACACKGEWRAIRRVLHKGLDHAADVSQRKVRDPDSPYLDEASA